ncbi:MAG: hypothetical protein M3Z33_13150 [Actinomycetota bacterium]|nr:hypothetical protein [Actinomycetota bacterium]
MATPDFVRVAATRRLEAGRLGREALAGAGLAGIVVASFLFVVASASGPFRFVRDGIFVHDGLPTWITGPLAGLSGPLTDEGLIVLSGALFGLYLLVLAFADAVRPSWAIAAIVIVHVLFLLGPPQWLSDAFNYLGFARLGVLHGINPYAHTPAAVPMDSSFQYVTWPHLTSPYGPLFTLGSYALVPLGLAGGLWALKLGTVAASLGCLVLVWRIAQRLERPPVAAVMFVGLNPLVLAYGVGGAHNDVFMLLALLAGVLWALEGRASLGAGAVVAAAAIKASAGLALPFMWIAGGHRSRAAKGAAVAAAGVLGATAIAFGSNVFGALTSFSDQGGHTSLRSFPGQLSQAFAGSHDVSPGIHIAVEVAFVLVLAGLLVATWRGLSWIAATGWAMLALLLALAWAMPWYVAWVLPFAAFGGDRRLRGAALTCTAFFLVVRMPYPPF